MNEAPSRQAQLRAVGTAFLRRRPWIVAPAFVAHAALLAAGGVPTGQLAAVLGGFSLLFAFFAWEAVALRAALVSARWLFASLAVTLAGISVGTLATGGLGSPLLPLLFAPTVVGFAAFGAHARSRALMVALAAALVAMAAVPVGVPFPAIPAATARWMSLVASLTTLALLGVGVVSLADAYARAGESVARANEALLAEAEARAGAMESLGAQVAHEIKNPLTAIKGLTDLIAEKTTDAKDRARLEVVGAEVARIERVLREYLSFSRPLGEVAREETRVDALLRETAGLLEARAEGAGVALSAEGGALTASVDPRRVKEAALNLLLNALDASEGGGAVRVRWAREARGVVITVEDEGRGMSGEILARVGDAYFTTRAGGTGLGVRLARRVAEAHGGSLSFESSPGRGTRATLVLGETPEGLG